MINIRSRIDRLENRAGIRFSPGKHLADLRQQAEFGQDISHPGADELRELIDGCENAKLRTIYCAALRATEV